MSVQSSPTTKELWFRWVTLGALSPVMRTHHGKSADENWNIESDPSSIAHFRRWGRFHIRLFPYLYGLAAGGEEGVTRVLDILRIEIERDMRLLGVTKVSQIGDRHIRK